MLATAVIVFREMLEAALIIGIVAAATRGVLHRNAWIISGIIAGLLGAIIVAVLADVIMNLANGVGQEIFNAMVLLAAVMMLAWHNIWMARHSRELVTQMKQVGAAVKEGGKPMYALGIVVAVAVLREGSEVVLFLYGQAAGGLNTSMIVSGGVAGLIVGAAVGFALYFGLLRIPTQYLFVVTGWLILLLAAGMASQAAKFLSQADIIPTWGRMWDSSAWLSDDSVTGRLLHTLIGYDANPLGIQLVVYLLTLLVIGGAMKLVNQKTFDPKETKPGAMTMNALIGVLLVCLFTIGSSKTWADPASYVYSPNVVKGETELEFHAGYYGDDDNSVDGTRAHEFSVGHGMSDNWFSEVELGWEKLPHAGVEYSGLEWVNIFQLTEPGEHIVDFGIFTNMGFPDAHNDPNTVEIGPMFEKELGSTVNNLNLTWVRDYGSHADHITTFEYTWQTRVKGDPLLEYGFQAMGDLGEWSDMKTFNNQEHKIGPALFGEFKVGNGSDKLKYDGALLFGVTDDSPDYTLRITVEYEIY